jgi:hypothetical protein
MSIRSAALAAALLLAAGAAETAEAQSVTAEQAVKNYREQFKSVDELDCPTPSEPDEIVVCGRPPGTKGPYELPLPVERVPGERVKGEPATEAALACFHNCYQGLDLIKMAKVGGKIVDHILHPD